MKKIFTTWVLLGIFWMFGDAKVLAQEMQHLHSIVIDSQTDTLLKGTHHGLYESRDDGKSWKKRDVKVSVPGTDFMTLVADTTNPKVIYAGGHDLSVVKSRDGGMTWQQEAKGLPTMDIHALAIDPTKPNRLHAWAVRYGLYRSDNGAKNWIRMDDGPENPNVTSVSSVPIPTGMGGIYLYFGTAAGLYRGPDCF